jgi:hypothetical protein
MTSSLTTGQTAWAVLLLVSIALTWAVSDCCHHDQHAPAEVAS